MFRKEQLILLLFLSGCTTIANDNTADITPPIDTIENVVIGNEDLLKIIDSTLGEADAMISKIEENKINANRKMVSLKQLVHQEEELIKELNRKLSIKDSIISDNKKEIEILNYQLESLKNFSSNTEDILKRYRMSYNTLIEENNLLKLELDETYSRIEYLDSLVFTNKKLTKIYESN